MTDNSESYLKYIDVVLPIKTISEINTFEHWTKRYARSKAQKSAVKLLFREFGNIELPCIVLLRRIGKRFLDDDNLPTALKYVRDAIADSLIPGLNPGVADGDKRIQWHYDQVKGKQYGVRVVIGKRVKDL